VGRAGAREAADGLGDAARQALLADRSALVDTPEGEVFLQVHNPPLRAVVVGAVHIAQALAPMAALAGFDVTVVDPRRAFASDARFPRVRLVRAWPDEALAAMDIDHRTAVVTLSHDPKLDDPALEAALRSGAFYVGALGSRRTHAKRAARLAVATLAQMVERLRSAGVGTAASRGAG
jgi:xanthine dehydrogenase accessory factor